MHRQGAQFGKMLSNIADRMRAWYFLPAVAAATSRTAVWCGRPKAAPLNTNGPPSSWHPPPGRRLEAGLVPTSSACLPSTAASTAVAQAIEALPTPQRRPDWNRIADHKNRRKPPPGTEVVVAIQAPATVESATLI